MEWLANNWIWIAFGLAFFAMHKFGHGGHGGRHRGDVRERDRRDREPLREGTEPPAAAGVSAHAGHGDTTSSEGRRRHHRGC
jgi:hypothetical protein